MANDIVEHVTNLICLENRGGETILAYSFIENIYKAMKDIPEEHRQNAQIRFNGFRHLVLEYVRPPTEEERIQGEEIQRQIDEHTRQQDLKKYYQLKEKLGL